jgi:hypothetical protein
MNRTFFTSVCCTCILLLAGARDTFPQSSSDNGRKHATAVRVPAGSIRVDGRLDEAVWRDIPPIADFVQREPNEGARPSDPIEVRFAYDDDVFYVGARMHSDVPIQAPLGRRDAGEQSEFVLVSLDTYLDRRTASSFGVTASGVRLDRYHSIDQRWNPDANFNPVWEARTTIDADGWTAELWIPFSQLRFNERESQVWGLNVQRWVPSRNEEVYWSPVGRTTQGWASLFGDLHGIDGIRPSRRLELLPYVSGGSHLVGDPDPADPFAPGANLSGGVGLDAKVGLGSNLTLEATVNPDFGQVDADPAEVNLSAFETFFSERRPFFVEGANLLLGNVNNYFYSRRVGAAPPGDADGDFVESPRASTILGAAKLTGRLASGTSIGLLGAVTAEESARTFSIGQPLGQVRVAPQTTFAVARAQQEFGPPGSTMAFMATAVHRDFEAGEPLAALLPRTALTFSTDSVIRLRGGEYELQWYAGGTRVAGDAAAIDERQRASARYLQRPDADYVSYDPRRTSMTGGKAGALIERRDATHWQWNATLIVESPEFDPADAGRISTGDGVQARAQLEYRETAPGPWWRNYNVRLTNNNEWNFGGVRQTGDYTLRGQVTWPNYWQTVVSGTFNVETNDARLTRGGPLMQKPRGWRMNMNAQTADSSPTRTNVQVVYGRDEAGGLTFESNAGLRMQPGSQWQLTIEPGYQREINTQQYVSRVEGGGLGTYGSRYIFGHVDRSTYKTALRLNYTFKPDMTLELYAEPFAASGRYDHIGELVAARTRLLRTYGVEEGTTIGSLDEETLLVTDRNASFTIDNKDFNVQSFRSNLVLRWEWRPGSTLYLVWQQDRAWEEIARSRASLGNMFGSLGQTGDNFFAVKATFWLAP